MRDARCRHLFTLRLFIATCHDTLPHIALSDCHISRCCHIAAAADAAATLMLPPRDALMMRAIRHAYYAPRYYAMHAYARCAWRYALLRVACRYFYFVIYATATRYARHACRHDAATLR